MKLSNLLRRDAEHREVRATAWVVPEPGRCVQCGICSYNCPIGIDVRRHAWLGIPVKDSHCLTCGECVLRCPRGVLFLQRSNLFDPNLVGQQ
jgi:Fe-S-cluster-containing hydrogenase component 2